MGLSAHALIKDALVAEMVDASDLGSDVYAYGFKSLQAHHMDWYLVWEDQELTLVARVGSTPTQSTCRNVPAALGDLQLACVFHFLHSFLSCGAVTRRGCW